MTHSEDMKEKVINFLTLDVEEWFDAEIPRRKLTTIPDEDTNIETQIEIYLEICNRLNIKSTCFVLGKLAEKKPHIVKRLYENGHEIASHSYAHKLIYTMSPAEFREDLHKSISILEDLTGKRIKGFRAPSWSVNSDIAAWFYKILEEESLIYSSSIYPAKTFLYGMPGAPQNTHRVKNTSIIEIPQQLLNLGILKIGIAGGTFLRLIPEWFVRQFIQRKNRKGRSVFIYLHPWELVFIKYPVDLSYTERIIQYYGIRKNPAKIESVCSSKRDDFQRMDQFSEIFNTNSTYLKNE